MGLFRRRPMFAGILVIALGVVWLLKNLGLLTMDIGDLFRVYWPVLLIAWGVDVLVPGLDRGGAVWRFGTGRLLNGLVLLLLGAVILGSNLGYYQLNFGLFWKVFWPVLIILLGWSILRGGVAGGGTHWAVMSGLELKNEGWKLDDGNYLAFMGGAKIDLSVAEIPQRETTLSITAVMGGVEVRVPPGLNVECEGAAVLGGVKFFREEAGGIVASRRLVRSGNTDSQARVKIYCRAVMGGIEIKDA
ncbi:MAG: cell wall-active antibiotics response protein LiaF [Bacillota bacterium]